MSMKIRKLILIIIGLFFVSFLHAQNDKFEKERFAQWNLNYAEYLIDVGKYLEALDAYNTAYETTLFRKTKVKALLLKANLLATFLDADEEALKIYEKIIKEFPEAKEIALYRKGLLLFDKGKWTESIKTLSQYLREFPYGRFKFQAEILIERAKKAISPPKPKIYPAKRPKIRVLLYRKLKRVAITGNNLIVNGRRYFANTIECYYNNVVVCGNILGFSILIKASSPLKIISGRKSKKVRGSILIKPKNSKIMVINVLDIEKYLYSVVPSESYAKWSIETLKAQAVAARTYAYYQILHRKSWDYDLVANESDQAYKGIRVETAKTTRAVNETLGEVLIEYNRPILAMYTANSGGYTADAGAIFQLNKRYLVAHPDPSSLKGKMAYWKKVYSINEMEKRFRRIGLNITGLKDIIPVKRGPSGRIVKIKIVAVHGGGIYRTRGILLRALKLPEILFSIYRYGDKFVFEGRGWGHGVGYSQWGGAILGKNGYSYRQILRFYYPNT